MHNLKFNLKQHTPLIHFQHEQDGATLRASEVKPRLDRFILTNLGCGDYENGVNKARKNKWLVGDGEHGALDYKMRIVVKNIKNPKSANDIGLFFGNMGEENKDKYKLSKCESCEIQFIIKNKDIKNLVFDNYCEFFGENNFGARQSKGFGSFYPIQTKGELKQYYKEIDFPYSFELSCDINTLFHHLDLFYRSLRSGINIIGKGNYELTNDNKIKIQTTSTFYFKSLLFLYTKNKLRLQLEKKTIKETFLNEELKFGRKVISKNNNDELNYINQKLKTDFTDPKTIVYYPALEEQKELYRDADNCINYSQPSKNKTKYFFKDMFGFAPDESWFTYRIRLQKKGFIERFASPLFFKIIEIPKEETCDINKYRIYFKAKPIPSLISKGNHTFDFNIKNNRPLPLQLYNEFDFNDFFKWIFNINNFSIDKYVDNIYKETDEFEILENIYSQLQKKKNNA